MVEESMEKEQLTDTQISASLNELDKVLSGLDTEQKPQTGLSGLDILDVPDTNFKPSSYTTDLIDQIQKLEPSLTVEQVKQLIDYVKGVSKGRPEFLDQMLTQTNEKLIEAVKLMSILQLSSLPKLFDYQNTLIQNLIDPSALKDMTYDEMAKTLASVNKTISDSLQLGLRVANQMPNTNTTPTKVEKLANALMNVPESTRDRIEEIIASEMNI